jgi:hypothetical protein
LYIHSPFNSDESRKDIEMSEITKLYENAGIEKEVIKGCYDYYSKLGIDIWKENDCAGKNCDTCKKDKSIKRYPPFTAEKQLEIVKQILFSTWWMNLKRLQFSEKFAEGLAQMINELWQDLSEEERQQVKGILE